MNKRFILLCLLLTTAIFEICFSLAVAEPAAATGEQPVKQVSSIAALVVTFLPLLAVAGIIYAIVLSIRTHHAKNQNARDIHASLKNGNGIPVSNSLPTNNSSADELEKLAKLHRDGALTDAEFEAAKKKHLGI